MLTTAFLDGDDDGQDGNPERVACDLLGVPANWLAIAAATAWLPEPEPAEATSA